MKGNSLYAFRPSVLWRYCDGLTLICADTLLEAILLGNKACEDDQRDWDESRKSWSCCSVLPSPRLGERGLFFQTEDGAEGTDSMGYGWVFEREFKLAEPCDKGVVLSRARYA